jgi:dimethylaniline monooxygenase (N-oxide forming)
MATQYAGESSDGHEFHSPWAEIDGAGRAAKVDSVAVIGAGVAGLCTAKTLIAEGLRCTLFERNAALGGVWADGYSNFGVQVQKELYEIPDWPLPPDAPDFTPGPAFRDYLQGYADHFGVTPCLRLGASVTALERRDDGGWIVTYRQNGAEKKEAFDLVVVSVGLYSSRPWMPSFPGEENFDGKVMHIAELKSRDQLQGKRVAVLGYGKSATDAAVEAAAVAEQTTLIFREAHWPVPRKLAGILPFKWGMLHRLTSALLPPYQRPSGLERVVHVVGLPAVWLYWRLVEILLRVQFGLGPRFGRRADLVPRTPVEVDCFGESTMLPRPEFFRLVRDGTIDAQRTEIAEYRPSGVVLRNGVRRDIDVMVLATGWTTDYGFLPEAVRSTLGFEEDGYYLYRHMLHPDVPDMVFIGCDAATFCCVLTASLQARWLAELLRRRHRLPPREAMLREIEEMKA